MVIMLCCVASGFAKQNMGLQYVFKEAAENGRYDPGGNGVVHVASQLSNVTILSHIFRLKHSTIFFIYFSKGTDKMATLLFHNSKRQGEDGSN